MSPEQREEFTRSISPEGLAEWRRLHVTESGDVLDPAVAAMMRLTGGRQAGSFDR